MLPCPCIWWFTTLQVCVNCNKKALGWTFNNPFPYQPFKCLLRAANSSLPSRQVKSIHIRARFVVGDCVAFLLGLWTWPTELTYIPGTIGQIPLEIAFEEIRTVCDSLTLRHQFPNTIFQRWWWWCFFGNLSGQFMVRECFHSQIFT